MIVAFSTSSPIASVALIGEDGALIAESSRSAPMAASCAAMQMLEDLLSAQGLSLRDSTGFLADLGPGSFTGVRVGVTLAKTLAFASGARAAGLPSFDLISTLDTVVIPSKKGEYFVKRPNQDAIRTPEPPKESFVGFGHGNEGDVYPSASAFAHQLHRLTWLEPEQLLPTYLIEPSISMPKKPFAGGGVG